MLRYIFEFLFSNVALVSALLLLIALLLIYYKIWHLKRATHYAFEHLDHLYQHSALTLPQWIRQIEELIAYEKEHFYQLTSARERYLSSRSLQEKILHFGAMKEWFSLLVGAAENYPELISPKRIAALKNEIRLTDEEFDRRKANFRDLATQYNSLISLFPLSFLATILGYKRIELE